MLLIRHGAGILDSDRGNRATGSCKAISNRFSNYQSPEALSEYYSFLSNKNRSREVVNPFAALTESRIPSLPGMSMLDTAGYSIDGPLSTAQVRKLHFSN